MSPIRLRHPKGVSTIQVDLEADSTTVRDLQQAILAATEIPPSLQDRECPLTYTLRLRAHHSHKVKSGYPPRSLTLIPQLPLSSLGLQKGDQLIVTQASGSGITHAPLPSSAAATASPSLARASKAATGPPIEQPGKQALGDEYVETDGGALIHRVSHPLRGSTTKTS
jgi:ubiquitin thioesterase OTU1